VIEAGPNNADIHASHMPLGTFSLFFSDVDWKTETVPQKHLNNRVLPLARGKMLGGSSTINGTLCVWGHKTDYDEWGLEGWSGDDMFNYMKKVGCP
jgi:choline dehydrogenase-like flavoprotein